MSSNKIPYSGIRDSATRRAIQLVNTKLEEFTDTHDYDIDQIERTAAEDISALYFVAVDSKYEVSVVTWSDVSKANNIVGITMTAVTSGNEVAIQNGGEVQDSYFSFSPGRVYIGSDGMPTQTTPTSGKLLQPVGVATDVDSFLLMLETPLIRS